MRRMLTITRIVAVYLLLGLVATWAVAWGLALRLPTLTPITSSYTHYDLPGEVPGLPGVFGSGGTTTNCKVARSFGHTSVLYSSDRLDGQLVFRVLGLVDFAWPNSLTALDIQWLGDWGKGRYREDTMRKSAWRKGLDRAFGFPALALWCAWRDPQTWPNPSDPYGGIALPLPESISPNDWTRHYPRALPYMPIWSGLALNTAFYALVFFLAVRLTKGTRHLVRFRCGRCPQCGYDLLGRFDVACSECGHQACRRRAAVV